MLHIKSEYEQADSKAPVMQCKLVVKRVEIPTQRIYIFNSKKKKSIHIKSERTSDAI